MPGKQLHTSAAHMEERSEDEEGDSQADMLEAEEGKKTTQKYFWKYVYSDVLLLVLSSDAPIQVFDFWYWYWY